MQRYTYAHEWLSLLYGKWENWSVQEGECCYKYCYFKFKNRKGCNLSPIRFANIHKLLKSYKNASILKKNEKELYKLVWSDFKDPLFSEKSKPPKNIRGVLLFLSLKKRERNKNKIDSYLIKYFGRLVEMILKRELEIINL